MILTTLMTLALQAPPQEEPKPRVEWTARTAEHLLSRAGFGASRARIERAVTDGLEATIDELFAAECSRDPYLVIRYEPEEELLEDLSQDERRALLVPARQLAAQQLRNYRVDWFERILENEDPLRERMLLFWHGFFTTAASVIEQHDKVLRQLEMLREGALGNYADLLYAIARDPAMLEYLDNDENKKKWANENLARELMELFSLGEGNYTENDIKQAARALTGRSAGPDGLYRFSMREHDTAMKKIFGVEKRFDGDDLVALLLEQEACAVWVSGRLLEYFEGRAPSQQRHARYADLLRSGEYEIEPFLRTLFADPDFYREEVIGSRVTSPIDLLVGTCHRVGLDPPPLFFVLATSVLGQELMEPPNVKGWEEGESWISTSTILLRGNLIGILLGTYSLDGPDSTVREAIEQAFPRELRTLRAFGESRYRPRINLTSRVVRYGARVDQRVVDFLIEELLATEVEEPARDLLIEYLASERAAAEIEEGAWETAGLEGEALLRRLAHLILSLAEAQLS